MDRVLEIGGFAAGYCGRQFVRQGADVVRVDGHETWPGWSSTAASDAFLHAGKRRVADLADETLAELAGRADVVVCEAAIADALAQLGFDAWTTSVKIAITPFGLTGPKRNWQATPHTLLAMGGYTYLIGDEGRAPLSLPGHYVEYQSGALAHAAANACLLAERADSVDISMLETVMSLSQFTTVRWHCAGEIRGRHGSDFWFVVPSELFRCADGWAYVNIVPSFWDAFTVFLDKPELLVDERFTTNDLRMLNRDALHALTADVLAGLSKAELLDRAESCRIPLGVVLTLDEVLDDPHLNARQSWETVQMIDGRLIKVPRQPARPPQSPAPEPLVMGCTEDDSGW